MALYAFDGTWNKDKPGASADTNVLKFANAFRPGAGVHYVEGVGVRFGLLGRVFGGIAGAGGWARIRSARQALAENLARGDSVIDVIGFSRGAALALEFAERTLTMPARGAPLQVRFLGLWDTVHSFGIPGNSINLGWEMTLPGNVRKCFHALALDERRHSFPLTRLSTQVADATREGRLYEVWFRGVHSDVGGGNRNEGLSSISLYWMLRCAQRCGLEFEPRLVERFAGRRDPDAPISVHDFDPVKNRFRTVRWTDWVHESVGPRRDRGKRQHNNPPAGLTRMADDGSLSRPCP